MNERIQSDAIKQVFRLFQKCGIILLDPVERKYGKDYGKSYDMRKFSDCLYKTIQEMSCLEIDDMLKLERFPMIWARLDKNGKTEYYKPTREDIEEAKEKIRNRNK